ncbi:hypothetical protein JCM3775_005327 [Rhodotorula graminis]
MPRRKAKTLTTAVDPHDTTSSTSGVLANLDSVQMTTTASSTDGNGDGGREGDTDSKQKAVDNSDTATTKPKKRTRKRDLDPHAISNKAERKHTPQQTALFKLPIELLDSIFSQVGSDDLLSLTKTCKVVRAALLGAHAAPIWKAAREQRKLPLPSSMTEQQLAELLYGKKCHACGSTSSTELHYVFRCRLCRTIIRGDKLRRELKGVHPRAADCVAFFDYGISWDGKPQIDYLVRDLWAVSATLYELAEQDEVAEYALEAARLRTSTRSRRIKTVPEDLPQADQLETFVKRRKEWVEKELEEIDAVREVVSQEESAALRLSWAEEARVREEERRKVESLHGRLQTEHDWTEEQVEWYDDHDDHERVPDAALDDDADAWADFRDWIQAELEREAAATALRRARSARRAALEPYYRNFANSFDSEEKQILPSFHIIVDWPVFKPLWEPADAVTITDSIWRRVLPDIRKSFEQYQEEIRVEAIRAILAATRGVRIDSLSTDPSDYPEDEYDDDWFARPTHLFLGSRHDPHQMMTFTNLLPYPETLWRHSGGPDLRISIKSRIDEHQVLLVRLMLEAIEVDEEDAVEWDLSACGSWWRWRNNPYKARKERTRRYNWVELLAALRRRGPNITSLRSGYNLPKIDARGDDEEDEEEKDEEQGGKSEDEQDEQDE